MMIFWKGGMSHSVLFCTFYVCFGGRARKYDWKSSHSTKSLVGHLRSYYCIHLIQNFANWGHIAYFIH